MTDNPQDITDAFVAWVKEASRDELKDFASQIEGSLYDLEEDDYFGTEGMNKRFA